MDRSNLGRNVLLHKILSLDLGAGSQPTALAIVEQEVRRIDGWQAETVAVRVRALERLPLDTTYPGIVNRVREILASPSAKEGSHGVDVADIVLGVTGSGRAIVPLFRAADLAPIVTTISRTENGREMEDGGEWRIPRAELAGNLLMMIQTDRLKVAAGIEHLATLKDELTRWRMRPPSLNTSDPEAWREAANDDLVLAIALGAWRSARNTPKPPASRDELRRKIDEHAKALARGIV